MRLSVLCTDRKHPVISKLKYWQAEMVAKGHCVSFFIDKHDLVGGDILFLVSCAQIIGDIERRKFRVVLVLHASDLPRGRGWSPHIWSILNGANRITVCLLEARDPVDSGDIWLRTSFELDGHELLSEINEKLFSAELGLMDQAVEKFDVIVPTSQTGVPGPYMQKRSPEDSRLDPDKSIAAQFDLLRIVDNERYPAYVKYRGKKYLFKIEKTENEQ